MNKNTIDILWNRKTKNLYSIRNIKLPFNKFSFSKGYEVVRQYDSRKSRVLFRGNYQECKKWVVENRIPISSVSF